MKHNATRCALEQDDALGDHVVAVVMPKPGHDPHLPEERMSTQLSASIKGCKRTGIDHPTPKPGGKSMTVTAASCVVIAT